jgi:polyferredoxin
MASDLDSEFAATEQQIKQAGKALEDLIKRRQADDRSMIAKVIVAAFVVLVVWVVVAVTLGTYFYDWESLVEPAKFLMAILGSVMLPVVTLVIGYYFGSK